MASRFATFTAQAWARQCPPAALVVAGFAQAGHTARPPLKGEEALPPPSELPKEPLARSASNLKPHHLSSWQTEETGLVHERDVNTVLSPMSIVWKKMNFLNPDELVLGHIIKNDSKIASRRQEIADGCVRANACKDIWWEPTKVKAAIVTCGGLCPGLNSIIREVTLCLNFDYGVTDIYGIQAGYNGLSHPIKFPPIPLDAKDVREIHMKGGSILKAARGGFDAKRIVSNLEEMGINMLFLIGGDGTQFAGHLLYEEAKKQNVAVSIVGVPKSIDNDVLFFDKTFGFDSAVAAASEVIRNGFVEATSCHKGVGIVKLMGRDAGYVAMSASLASTIVDLCLIPEVKVQLEEVDKYVDTVLDRKDFMVIAVAEGAGQEWVSTGEKDATGHTIYGDVGVFLKSHLNKHLKASGGRTFYIDPSYIIRSCPIRPNDHIYCSRLARDAVHSAMRGYTGVCVGAINNIIVIMPSQLDASGKKRVNIRSSQWQSCVQSCKMPAELAGWVD